MTKKLTKSVKLVGLERSVDKCGRLVIPFEYRNQYKMHAGDQVIIYPTNAGFFICSKDVEIDGFFE